MKGLFTLVIVFLVLQVSAQKYAPKGGNYGGKETKYRSSVLKRNATDVFPLDPQFALNGWSAAIGATYMLPLKEGEGSSSVTNNDTTIRSDFKGKPKGKLGLYAEVSYFHAFQNPGIFHFYDVGISYRQYKGGENFSGSETVIDSATSQQTTNTVSQNNSYSDQAVSLIANVTNHRHFSRYGFVQNSIGINVNYFISKSRSAPPTMTNYNPEFPADIQGQINYRLGVGWKASNRILVIPSIQVPLITVYPFENGKSSLAYFSTRQYPLIFSIRIMMLRPISEDCVVPNYDGPTNFEN